MTDTIFMIHGMWGGPWCWEHYRRFFERAGYRCVVASLPYHGSPPTADPDPRLGSASLIDYVAALESELAQLDTRPILMGHSMGGLLGQMLAARGLCSALVLLTPAAPAGVVAVTPSVIRSFWSIQRSWGFWRKPARLGFRDAVYALLHRLPQGQQADAYERLVAESGRVIFEIGYWPLDSARASRVAASRVRCPVLVVGANADRIVPVSVAWRVARKYRHVASFMAFANHAHWILAEPGWEEVAEHVENWLARHCGSGRAASFSVDDVVGESSDGPAGTSYSRRCLRPRGGMCLHRD